MAGADTPELAEAAVEGGADLVELGFPFSDPLADGPVIRAAAERALADGMRTERCLECPSLRVGKESEPAEQGHEQLVETREAECASESTPVVDITVTLCWRAFLGGGEQRRLADPRVAPNDQRAALLLEAVDERVQRRQLPIAPRSWSG